jgi:hypothetical protein
MRTTIHSSKTKSILLSIAMIFLALSCSVDSALDERLDKVTNGEDIVAKGILQPLLLSTSTLTKVDIFTDASTALSGTVTVEIRNSDGSVVLGSSTVAASLLIKGLAKNTFPLSTPVTLAPGDHYRIYVTRSDTHHMPTNNYIFWKTCPSGVDAYPPGVMIYSPGWMLDFAFITYNGSSADQQQTSATYGFAIGSAGSYLWQEFVPSVPTSSLTSVSLNLSVGFNTTGTLTVQIREANGKVVVAETTLSRKALPNGTNWVNVPISATLVRDQLYRIYVTRSGPHDNATQNTIFWRTSPGTGGGVNAYPDGVTDIYPIWTLDFAFRTYTVSGIDQQQNTNNYSFAVFNNGFHWQEFVPRNP